MGEQERRTIVDALCRRAEQHPDQVAYHFYSSASNPEVVTCKDLWFSAAAVAQRFRASGLEGERIILATTNNQNFVTAFFGCMLAGATAVPSPPSGRKRQAERLRLLAADAQAKAIVGDEDEVVCRIDLDSVLKFDSRALGSHEENALLAEQWEPPALHEESLAFLQYTSGSTGDPKGVMVSHGNIMANCAAIQLGMQLSERSVVLTALPLFHDMGLIGGMMEPMFCGCVGHMLPPVQFIQHPEWWLQLISSVRATHSGGPNFMFELAARAITPEQLAGVDLSSWEVAFCGAEPIRAASIARFTERFTGHGFRASSFHPCYGMAETTLYVTGVTAGQIPKIDRELSSGPVYSCGSPRMEMRVEIVDPETGQKLAGESEGEVWVNGLSVAKGYWNRPELTRQIFQAFTGDGDGPFLRTGDLGFRKDGEIYITGRIKDVIIVRGRKYAPQDLELEAERSHAAIQPNGCVAFTVDRSGADFLVVAAELRRTELRKYEEHDQIRNAVKAAIFAAFQLSAGEVVLLFPHSVPRTSSGKVKRAQCRRDYLHDELARAPQPVPNDAALNR